MDIAGIEYTEPEVMLLQETGIGTSETAARVCYNSFEQSENLAVKGIADKSQPIYRGGINNIEHSDLLDNLAWTYFHHSILEHAVLTYYIRGTSRAVLQEHARHRIQAISVRSTRYTMSDVINAFVAEMSFNTSNTIPSQWFLDTILELDMFVTSEPSYNKLQATDIWNKLKYQWNKSTVEFIDNSVSKDAKSNGALEQPTSQQVFNALKLSKQKRNVGDNFKHIVNDNWKVDMVVSFNLRSLKNYFGLRDSGAAYAQIRWLAQAMKAITPKKYLDLIVKDN